MEKPVLSRTGGRQHKVAEKGPGVVNGWGESRSGHGPRAGNPGAQRIGSYLEGRQEAGVGTGRRSPSPTRRGPVCQNLIRT